MVEQEPQENKEQPVRPPFKINPLYQNMFQVTEDQIVRLLHSIERYGQLHSIFVNQDGVILNGHKRNTACERLGKKPEYVIKKFDNPDEELLFVLESNLSNGERTTFERIEAVVLFREPIEKKRAEERRLGGLKRGDKSPMAQINTYGEEGRVREILAPAAGVGDATYYKGELACKECFKRNQSKTA